MKRVCKNTNIEDRKLIERAVLLCLNPAKKRQRGDTRKLFARLLNVSVSTARSALKNRDELYFKGVDLVVDMLQKRIKEKKLHLRFVTQQLRRDPSSGKNRKISVLSIEQLLLDHVAVLGLADLSKRIGDFQVSSIPKRGAAYGKKAIERWIRKKSNKYAVKLDIKDFYGSINRNALLMWLGKRIKNEPLMWLIRNPHLQC